jgi:hypothetical protein
MPKAAYPSQEWISKYSKEVLSSPFLRHFFILGIHAEPSLHQLISSNLITTLKNDSTRGRRVKKCGRPDKKTPERDFLILSCAK